MNLLIFIITLIVLILLGVPIAFSMMLGAFAYFIFSGNLNQIYLIPESIFSGINVYVLTAIPFFMIAGEIMNKAGISERLINFSNLIIGRVRGGLAQVNVLTSILFAGITGVALGDIAALGKIFLPAMTKQGYSRSFTAAVTAASSLVGPIIPPSTIIVLYCAVMGVSVGAMFIGAIIPGILIGLSDMFIVHIVATKRKYPKSEVKVSPKKLVLGFKDAILALIMPIIIVGGILGGIFTPTEASGVAILYACIVGVFIYKSVNGKHLLNIFKIVSFDSAKILLIIACASIISWIFGIEHVSDKVAYAFTFVSNNKFVLIFMINLFFLFMGTWLDPGVSMILFAPILFPLAATVGIHPIQYGIMVVVNSNIGFCTPPVGNVLYAICDMTKIDILKVAKELLPFIVINFIIVLLVGCIPNLSLLLPRLFGLL